MCAMHLWRKNVLRSYFWKTRHLVHEVCSQNLRAVWDETLSCGRKTLFKYFLWGIAQDSWETANQSWQSGNQTTVSALKVLKVREEKFSSFSFFFFLVCLYCFTWKRKSLQSCKKFFTLKEIKIIRSLTEGVPNLSSLSLAYQKK